MNTTAQETAFKDCSAAATYDSNDKSESANKELQKAGYQIKKLPSAGRDHHTGEQATAYNLNRDSVKTRGLFGVFWAGFCGLLSSSAFFWVPSLGPLLAAGPHLGDWSVAWLDSLWSGRRVSGKLKRYGREPVQDRNNETLASASRSNSSCGLGM